MRENYLKQLALLNEKLIEMGEMIEHAIAQSVKAFMEHDVVLAKKAATSDNPIDNKEKEIESLCLSLFLEQQPMASDLRAVSAALKMITDMERIGDHAADISELTLLMSNDDYISNMDILPEMARATIKMLNESIEAYVNCDQELAEQVMAYDDVVDNLFVQIKSDLIELIRGDAAVGGQAVDLIMVAKYFERIGDHAVNIAEWVIFSITGTYKDTRII